MSFLNKSSNFYHKLVFQYLEIRSYFICLFNQKVQPDVDELESGEKQEEEKKLGKLQFSLDYDFQQNNVSLFY